MHASLDRSSLRRRIAQLNEVEVFRRAQALVDRARRQQLQPALTNPEAPKRRPVSEKGFGAADLAEEVLHAQQVRFGGIQSALRLLLAFAELEHARLWWGSLLRIGPPRAGPPPGAAHGKLPVLFTYDDRPWHD